jgi:hypothetical protein
VTGLGGDTSYVFSVRAENGAGVFSDPDVTLSTHTLPFQVAILSIVPNVAQTLSFAGPHGPVTLDVPAGAFVQAATMTVTAPGTLPGPASPSAALVPTGLALSFVVTPSMEPQAPVTLVDSFQPAEVTGLNKSQLVLTRFDSAHNIWVPLPSQVDANLGTVTAQTDHLSIFEIMASVPPLALNNVKVFPNPFRPALGQKIVNFSNLPAYSTVRIFTVAGEKVADRTADASGMATWDGANQSGKKVSSGVYFALLESDGDKKVVNVAVER